jgi:SagB-type dehydrogenase family enzyme
MKQTAGTRFFHATLLRNLEVSDQTKGVPPPLLEMPCDGPGKTIVLPNANQCRTKDIVVQQAIYERKSVRDYSTEPMSIEELSFLLFHTQGLKARLKHASLRTVPSAGARHAFETYLLINRVTDIKPGIYRYLAFGHKLLETEVRDSLADEVTRACLGQTFVKSAAVAFLWAAVPYRMTWRYGERGFRYLWLDAGHVGQNLYLASEAIGCGCCTIGAFDDEGLNRILGLDGKDSFVIYIGAVGKKK